MSHVEAGEVMIAQLKTDDCQRRNEMHRAGAGAGEGPRGLETRRTLGIMAEFSHELRNYLGAIRGAMHVLKSGAVDDAAQERARSLMNRQIEQMARLVDDILDVSRMSNGALPLHRSRIDLCIVIANAMHAVEGIMTQREHRMTVSFPESAVWLHGDAARLEQVFVNLLVNAAKYTNVRGQVNVSVTRRGDEASVVVRDNGNGIAADVLPDVFEPYVQASPSSRKGGLGLGLPLVRSLVESHGGSVAAASAGAGLGCEFTVRLPVFTQR
jgi:signal transduction histidine kinase